VCPQRPKNFCSWINPQNLASDCDLEIANIERCCPGQTIQVSGFNDIGVEQENVPHAYHLSSGAEPRIAFEVGSVDAHGLTKSHLGDQSTGDVSLSHAIANFVQFARQFQLGLSEILFLEGSEVEGLPRKNGHQFRRL